MKKKILIGSIFAVLLMLSMPAISNIQAQPIPVAVPAEDDNECSICPESTGELKWKFPLYCTLLGVLYKIYSNLESRNAEQGHLARAVYWRLYKAEVAGVMIALDCANAPAAA